MKAITILASLGMFCSISAKASSFTVDSLIQFTPLVGSLSGPTADSTRILRISNPSGSFPPESLLIANGAPLAGEQNAIQNLFNNAQYDVTNAVNLPSMAGFGFSASGALTDTTNTILGFGPNVAGIQRYSSSAGFAGTLSMNFDCQLATGGPTEGAACFVQSYIFSDNLIGSDITVLPEIAIMDLRGNGQAQWNGSQIVASGSDYTLSIGFSTLDPDGAGAGTKVVVQNGVVVSVSQGSTPFILPSIGSSGTFAISALVQPVTYDLRSLIEPGSIQSFGFATIGTALGGTGEAGLPSPPDVPESSSCLLVGAGLGALMLRRSWGQLSNR